MKDKPVCLLSENCIIYYFDFRVVRVTSATHFNHSPIVVIFVDICTVEATISEEPIPLLFTEVPAQSAGSLSEKFWMW
jgi:hypothetical protein